MTSPMIQKDIVSACKIETIKAMFEELNGDCFALIVDESFDVSRKEQMAIVFRYIDRMGFVIERLIDIVHVEDTSEIDGLKMLIRRESKSVHSIHCFAHQLQLTLVRVSKKCVKVLESLALDARSMDERAKAMRHFEACQTFKIAFMLHLMRDVMHEASKAKGNLIRRWKKTEALSKIYYSRNFNNVHGRYITLINKEEEGGPLSSSQSCLLTQDGGIFADQIDSFLSRHRLEENRIKQRLVDSNTSFAEAIRSFK
ncbi:hypothetical protein H5410_062992 [Solanum commersonii]|uniref:DUF4371 domain-containing protein n=1 Tax=Solanum commersonii TaxID=4109 RepID=A0A9J5WCA7_SOLCO|nr:hypothetical protein H5410_062992 [Solanum commersonii]